MVALLTSIRVIIMDLQKYFLHFSVPFRFYCIFAFNYTSSGIATSPTKSHTKSINELIAIEILWNLVIRK